LNQLKTHQYQPISSWSDVMEKKPVPSLEFGAEHILGLDLVGTVEMPSPFPASGRVFLVRHPGSEGASGEAAAARYFVKVVQRINDSQTVTRFVSPEHVRAIRFHPATTAAAADAPALLTGDQLRTEMRDIDWTKEMKDHRSSHEIELHPGREGTVVVPESAPVLVRLEQSMPAALSLDALSSLRPSPCPHC
jgi:hypothetical protein